MSRETHAKAIMAPDTKKNDTTLDKKARAKKLVSTKEVTAQDPTGSFGTMQERTEKISFAFLR